MDDRPLIWQFLDAASQPVVDHVCDLLERGDETAATAVIFWDQGHWLTRPGAEVVMRMMDADRRASITRI